MSKILQDMIDSYSDKIDEVEKTLIRKDIEVLFHTLNRDFSDYAKENENFWTLWKKVMNVRSRIHDIYWNEKN